MTQERGTYQKKREFARAFLVGFDRSGMRPSDLFDPQRRIACHFVHHCFVAFEDQFFLTENMKLRDMIVRLDSLKHISQVLSEIAKARGAFDVPVKTLIEKGRLDPTRANELSDYWRWLRYLDLDLAKNTHIHVSAHAVSVGAWLVLLLSSDWWTRLEEAQAKQKVPDDLKKWHQSIQLTYKIASQNKPHEALTECQKLLQHENIKPLMVRLERIYPNAVIAMNLIVANLEPDTQKPTMAQATLKRVYLEYRFKPDRSTDMHQEDQTLRTWVIESFNVLLAGKTPQQMPPSRDHDTIWTIHNQMKKFWDGSLLARLHATDNLLNATYPSSKHLELAQGLDDLIGRLELPTDTIRRVLGDAHENRGS